MINRITPVASVVVLLAALQMSPVPIESTSILKETTAGRSSNQLNAVFVDGFQYSTIQSALSAILPTGGTLHISSGTYSLGSPIKISRSNTRIICDGGMRNTVIQYDGRAVIPAVIDVGTESPMTKFVQDFYMEGCTVRSTGLAENAIRLQGVHRSYLKNIDARDVSGSAILWRFGVGNVLSNIHCSSQDAVFIRQPQRCLDLEEIDSTHQFTTSAIIAPVIEGVRGAGIFMRGAQTNFISDAQDSINGISLDVEPGNGGSFFNVFTANLFESSVGGIDMIVNSSFNVFENDQSTVKTEIKPHANNNTFQGGQYAVLQIDSGATATNLNAIQTTLHTLSDFGNQTIYDNVWDFGTQSQILHPVFKETNPSYSSRDGLRGGGGYDPVDMVRGVWDVDNTPVVLSPTVLTKGKPWRAVFMGLWENNSDGTSLPQLPPYVEISSTSPDLAVGSAVLTFSVSREGLLQVVSSTHRASFDGTIFVFPSPATAAGTQSINVVGSVRAGSFQTTTDCNTSGSPAHCGSAAAGRIVLSPSSSSLVVFTTAVTSRSQILLSFDSSLGSQLGVTCSTSFDPAYIASRMPGSSFTVRVPSPPAGEPACYSYEVIN